MRARTTPSHATQQAMPQARALLQRRGLLQHMQPELQARMVRLHACLLAKGIKPWRQDPASQHGALSSHHDKAWATHPHHTFDAKRRAAGDFDHDITD